VPAPVAVGVGLGVVRHARAVVLAVADGVAVEVGAGRDAPDPEAGLRLGDVRVLRLAAVHAQPVRAVLEVPAADDALAPRDRLGPLADIPPLIVAAVPAAAEKTAAADRRHVA